MHGFASYKILLFCIALSLSMVPIILVKMGLETLNIFFITNNNILILLFVALLVVIVERVKFTNKIINYFAASTLSVYVMTDNFLVQKPLDSWLLHEVLNHWYGYGCILFAVVSCLCIDKMREMLFELFNTLFINVKSITRK